LTTRGDIGINTHDLAGAGPVLAIASNTARFVAARLTATGGFAAAVGVGDRTSRFRLMARANHLAVSSGVPVGRWSRAALRRARLRDGDIVLLADAAVTGWDDPIATHRGSHGVPTTLTTWCRGDVSFTVVLLRETLEI
jgi:hypothetical protein